MINGFYTHPIPISSRGVNNLNNNFPHLLTFCCPLVLFQELLD